VASVLKNRIVLAVVIFLCVIGLALPFAFLKLEWSFMKLRTFVDSCTPTSPPPIYIKDEQHTEARAILTQVTAAGTKYNGFVYKSCAETFSFGYTWFTNYFNVVCDTNDDSKLCTIWMENSKGHDLLGEKALNLWKLVHSSEESEEIIVKLDDDTMIQKRVLAEFVDEFSKNKDCVIAGVMNYWGDDFQWPLGRLYITRNRPCHLPVISDGRTPPFSTSGRIVRSVTLSEPRRIKRSVI
jgi:hypothetical protein